VYASGKAIVMAILAGGKWAVVGTVGPRTAGAGTSPVTTLRERRASSPVVYPRLIGRAIAAAVIIALVR
jgi:hypothetical protein